MLHCAEHFHNGQQITARRSAKLLNMERHNGWFYTFSTPDICQTAKYRAHHICRDQSSVKTHPEPAHHQFSTFYRCETHLPPLNTSSHHQQWPPLHPRHNRNNLLHVLYRHLLAVLHLLHQLSIIAENTYRNLTTALQLLIPPLLLRHKLHPSQAPKYKRQRHAYGDAHGKHQAVAKYRNRTRTSCTDLADHWSHAPRLCNIYHRGLCRHLLSNHPPLAEHDQDNPSHHKDHDQAQRNTVSRPWVLLLPILYQRQRAPHVHYPQPDKRHECHHRHHRCHNCAHRLHHHTLHSSRLAHQLIKAFLPLIRHVYQLTIITQPNLSHSAFAMLRLLSFVLLFRRPKLHPCHPPHCKRAQHPARNAHHKRQPWLENQYHVHHRYYPRQVHDQVVR